MKRLTTLLLAVMVASSMLFAAPVFADTSVGELGPNGKAAKTYFGADQYNNLILDKATTDDIQDYLYSARDITEDTGKPVIVNVKAGIFDLDSALSIPHNVVLVSESGVVYNNYYGGTMVNLKGAVYGGTFDGKLKKDSMIKMVSKTATASDKNMLVTKATLKNTYLTAVLINGAYKHGKVIGNTITNCQLNGVCAYRGGQYDVIEGNKITKIGHPKRTGDKKAGGSGIDLCSSDAKLIKNNTINDVYGHGISTDPSMLNKGCVITEVTGNTFSKIKTQGIYVENKCKISKIKNNKISNVKGCCIKVDKNASIGSMSGNKLSGGTLAKQGKHSLVSISDKKGGKKASVRIGKNNTFTGSYKHCIYIGKNATLTISGNGNVITKNKGNGIQVDTRGKLVITGKTTITKNRWGINMAKKANANIKRVTFKGNKKGAVYYLKGAKFKKSKCKVKGKIYKAG